MTGICEFLERLFQTTITTTLRLPHQFKMQRMTEMSPDQQILRSEGMSAIWNSNTEMPDRLQPSFRRIF